MTYSDKCVCYTYWLFWLQWNKDTISCFLSCMLMFHYLKILFHTLKDHMRFCTLHGTWAAFAFFRWCRGQCYTCVRQFSSLIRKTSRDQESDSHKIHKRNNWDRCTFWWKTAHRQGRRKTQKQVLVFFFHCPRIRVVLPQNVQKNQLAQVQNLVRNNLGDGCGLNMFSKKQLHRHTTCRMPWQQRN